MSFPLNNTENPITATERLKLNENWQRLSGYLFNLQYQINFLSGDADIDQILEDIEEAVTAANNAATNANSTIVEMNAALAQVQNVLDDANAIINDVTNVLDDANEALDNANEALDTANTAIAGANVATDAANTATTNANTATTNANAATDAANTATTNANAATTAANNAATTATQLIGQMETLITQGNALVTSLNEFDWKGAYSASVTYRKNNFVQYNRSTYVALKQNLGITPNDNGVDWRLAAGAGVDGQGAVNKVNGISPDANGNVTVPPPTTTEVNSLGFSPSQTDLASLYPTGVSVRFVQSSNGWVNSGTLTTFKTSQDGGSTFQTITPTSLGTRPKFRQFTSTSNQWGEWQEFESTTGAQAKVNAHANLTNNPHQVTSQQVNIIPTNTKNIEDSITTYPSGITTTYVNTTLGFPVYGNLTTYRPVNGTSNAGSYQTLVNYNSTTTRVRYWDNINSAWSQFVKQTEQIDVDKVTVGGRNYIKNSSDWTGAGISGGTISVSDEVITVTATNVATTALALANVKFDAFNNADFVPGEMVTQTVYARLVSGNGGTIALYVHPGMGYVSAGVLDTPGVWKKFRVTRPWVDATASSRIHIRVTGTEINDSVIEYKYPQLERGSSDSDWRPAITDDSPNLKAFKNQSQYQLATVNNSQIRITKPSDSARLFFKLTTAITSAVTVSLDGGGTSGQLRNFDNTQVTSLEPGFYEIVQDSTFFILRNKGGVSQADLDALITAANEVEANSNVIRTDLINTINTAYPEGDLSSSATFIQAIDMIPNIGSDKIRVQSGVFTASTTATTFKARDGATSLSLRYGQIDSLEFKPSRIELFSNSGANSYTTNFAQSHGGVNDLILVSPHNQSILNNSSNYSVLLDGVNAYVTENSFRLPVNNSGGTYYWTAYE